jgi:hypothetical protein
MTASKPSTAVVNEIESLRTHLLELATLPETDEPVISAYLDLLESPDYLRSKLLHWAVAARSTLNSKQRHAFDDSRHDVENVIAQQWPEEVRSVVVFSRRGENPLLLVLPFSASMGMHFDVSTVPSIFPLVQLKDRFHRFVVVIATEDASRIFEVTLGAISEEILTQRPELGGRLGREWGREHFHQRKRESDRRFQVDQVTIITNLMAKRGLNHLILAGNPHHVAGLREVLPKQIASRLVGELHKTPSRGDFSNVLDQAVEKFIEAESAESHSTVERLHEQVRRRALAVVGVENSRDAIVGGYAAELVISEELPNAEREELTRLATVRNLPIEVCEGDELLATHGGVGCLLRYRPAALPEEFPIN